jgi:hypothetical protein
MPQQPPDATALARPKSRMAQGAVLAVVAAAGGLVGVGGGYRLADKPTTPAPVPAVYFSPQGGCAQAITEAVNNAKAEVCVQAYTFDSSAIANSLAEARRRGLNVMVVMDAGKCYDDRNRARWLHERGVTVRVDSRHTIAHNKIMIIDGTTVITGSFNFTEVADKSHAENVLVLREPTVAAKYHANWEEHWNHSTSFEPRKLAAITGTITPEEAVRCEGKECAVEMTVRSVCDTGGLYFINSRELYTDPNNLAIVITVDAIPAKFANGQEFLAFLNRIPGRTVKVQGVVTSYKGRKQIKLTDTSQRLELPYDQ